LFRLTYRHIRVAVVLVSMPLAMIATACQQSVRTERSAPHAPDTILIPAGNFVAGSDQPEREYAYRLDEKAYGHDRTRKSGWYDRERARQSLYIDAYEITVTPITNQQYARFVAETGYRTPDVNQERWESFGLIHPYSRTRRHAWQNGELPPGREMHPVVLISWHDAVAYAKWLTDQSGQRWSLPTEDQWEKAVRGSKGLRFPWGNEFMPRALNSHDDGPFDTMPVGSFADGASEYAVLDGAGQVFEWTSEKTGNDRVKVKGGSWDDSGCGVCRPAASHNRPADLQHILIGFRLVRQVDN